MDRRKVSEQISIWCAKIEVGLAVLLPEERKEILGELLESVVIDRSGNVRLTLAVPNDISMSFETQTSTATPTQSPTPTPRPTPTATSIPSPTPSPTPSVPTPTPSAAPTPESLAVLVTRISPAIVRITSEYGTGSGVIFATDEAARVTGKVGAAFVVTNYHVIEGASIVTVSLHDGQKFSGTVQGWDSQRDIAVVEVCCNQNFALLDLADLGQVRSGDTVYAMGYPLGSESVLVTQGIISGLQFNPIFDRYEIQTDAAINSGNSGGPLISTSGKVLGLTTYVVRSALGAASVEGFGFAISSETLQPSLALLQLGGRFAALTPTPNPSISRGTFTHPDYGYSLDVPDRWELDADSAGTVLVYEGGTLAFVRVRVIAIDEVKYKTTWDLVRDPSVSVMGADAWSNFEVISSSEITRRSTGYRRDVAGYSFRATYEFEGQRHEHLEQWFVAEGYLYQVWISAPSIIWTSLEYVEVADQLMQTGFSFRPLTTKPHSGTPLPTPTPIPSPTPWQLGQANTCELHPGYAPTWYNANRLEYVESFDEDIEKKQGFISMSSYYTNVPNGYVEAEFRFVEANSFGFEFRKHSDDRVTVNDGIGADFLVIVRLGSRWEWRHDVRDRFTTDITETNVDRGALSNVVTGNRAWNKLGVYFNGTAGKVVFNDQVITTLRLEEADGDISYTTRALSGYYKGDPVIAQPVRNARITCP